MKKYFYTITLFLGAFLFSGCVSVPMASLSIDTDAKKFQSNEGLANVYLYRNETFGAAVGMPVTVDDKLAGKTASKTYFNWKLKPGTHTFKSITENTAQVTIKTEANKNYFIWQEVKMGLWAARSLLHNVSSEDGEKGVLESKMIQSNF